MEHMHLIISYSPPTMPRPSPGCFLLIATLVVIGPLVEAKNLREGRDDGSNPSSAVVVGEQTASDESNTLAQQHSKEHRRLQLPALTTSGTSTPFGECEGSCNGNQDCADGLECFTDFAFSIPGCSGTRTFGRNFCFVPEDGRPFGLCKGPCFGDGDCDFGLNCFQGIGQSAPGCSSGGPSLGSFFGAFGSLGGGATNVCAVPPAGDLVIVADVKSPANLNNSPLGECEGDCDTDADCQPGLLCFQRLGLTFTTVPGCAGQGQGGFDYCFRDPTITSTSRPTVTPNTAVPTAAPTFLPTRTPNTALPTTQAQTSQPTQTKTARPTSALTPLQAFGAANPKGNCQGPCFSDANCDFGFNCFSGSGGNIPGCSGATFGQNFCAVPPPKTLVLKADVKSPDNLSASPLGECEGDCDTDDDCEQGLVCFQRVGLSLTAVPDCDGQGQGGFDYCFRDALAGPRPTNAPTTVSPTTGPTTNAPSTASPTSKPSTSSPTAAPITALPTSALPTKTPNTASPTTEPTTVAPTVVETFAPTTQVPTERPTADLIPLQAFVATTPKGNCQGACFSDANCDFGLNCFSGSGGNIPGCSGATFGQNFCAVPPPKTLVLKADVKSPDNLSASPLGECEGDCDTDDDCEQGLVCFQRAGVSLTAVPDCDGQGQGGFDYCFKDALASPRPTPTPNTALPTTPVTLVPTKVPTTNAPSTESPTNTPTNLETTSPTLELLSLESCPTESDAKCGRCEGGCFEDLDCDFGLNCFKGFTSTVPGCLGAKPFLTNFCFAPPPGTLVLKGDDNVPADVYPLGECEGDCDTDADCQQGLLCFERTGFSLEFVPQCEGRGSGGSDYCFKPLFTSSPTEPTTSRPTTTPTSAAPTVPSPTRPPTTDSPTSTPSTVEPTLEPSVRPTRSPNTASPTTEPTEPTTSRPTPQPTVNPGLSLKDAGPFGLCEGDCRNDLDCKFGLICVRPVFGSFFVPGCAGFNFDGASYCVGPPPGNLVVSGTNEDSSSIGNFPLGECEGDCDSDADCAGSLKCFFRTAFEKVRACEGVGQEGVDYCFDPLKLAEAGDNGDPAELFPLGLCTGDCDDNLDCEGGLICFERDGFEGVPGCTGKGVFNKVSQLTVPICDLRSVTSNQLSPHAFSLRQDYCIIPPSIPIF